PDRRAKARIDRQGDRGGARGFGSPDRQQVKADHKTVGAIRKKKEVTGEIPQLKKTTGADGKARKRPSKPAQRELEPAQAHIVDLDAGHEHDRDLAEKLRAAEIKMAGLESEI